MSEALFALLIWPALVLAVCIVFFLIFWKPIARKIEGATRASYGDKAIDFERAAEQQKETKALPSPANPEPLRDVAKPMPSPVLQPRENEILQVLNSEPYTDEIKQAWLVRALAIAQFQRTYEITYRLIFGSQLALVFAANTSTVSDQQAREIFNAAKEATPDLYTAVGFADWFGFPVRAGLIEATHAGTDVHFNITLVGRDFFHYVVANGLPTTKYG